MTAQEYGGTRSGWVTLTAVLMFAVGFARIISAISYFDDSGDIANLSGGIFGGNLWAWGLWDLAIAILALFAGWSLLSNGAYGRVVAYIWAVVLIVNSFMIFGLAPWYAAAAITLGVLVVYGLATASGDET
jgi:hypothetical protein